ncbi:MAG: hypothetical protein ACTSR3_04340 [Candidatus Helarchaeota archaeon]
MAEKKNINLYSYLIDARYYPNYQNEEKIEFIPLKFNGFSPHSGDMSNRDLFFKTMFRSIVFTAIFSFIFHDLVKINYLGLQTFIFELMNLTPYCRADFFTYFPILILTTAFFDYKILIKRHVKFGYVMLTLPLMYIIMPGILDNYYIN